VYVLLLGDNKSSDDSHAFALSSRNSSNSSIDLNKKATTTTTPPTHITSQQQHQKSTEKTEIFYDEEKAMNKIAQTMSNVKNSASVCGDSLSPSFSMGVDKIKKGYMDFKRRGIKIRFITEITKENLLYCKELMQYVELRHMANVKGNMAVSETEYVATAKLEGEAKPVTQTIYSNVKAIIEQHRHFFENLWINAISAEQRIREIEEGIEPIKTEIIKNEEEISKKIIELVKESNELHIYSTTGGMQLIYNNFFEAYKDILKKHKTGEHRGIKWVTSIYNKKDIEVVTIFLNEGINIRHVKSTPFSSFALSDKLLNSTMEKMEEGKMVTNLLSSNDILYRDHYNTIFKELWKTGIDAKSRIKDIKEGRYINVSLIPNPKESMKFVSELNKSAKKEILILLSSKNGFLRTEKNRGFNLLNELASNGVKVKVLTPSKFTNEDKITDQIKSKYHFIEFRNLEFSLEMVIGITIVDREKSMIFEIKDDTKDNFQYTLGLAIYIEGKSAALSYVSIFDSLWKQTELYEQVKEAFVKLQINEKMQKEFINTAAHELRTPIQPILGLTQIIRSSTKDKEQIELLDIVIKNTKKLKKLAEDILDVSRIESDLLNLNKERFDLDSLILNIIKEFGDKLDNDKKIKFEYSSTISNKISTLIFGDKNRISQVIYNLISNSIKFISEEGTIVISIEIKNNSDKETVIVRVKDTGIGIDYDIFPNLFKKFITKSFQGTGLGLYISKNIIEAHDGKMWAENNKDGKGATFYFSLPLKTG
jgi:two-component system, OmpR family, sensor histidine kinase VicK